MADYHIYLHSEGGGSSDGNKTTPFSARKSVSNDKTKPFNAKKAVTSFTSTISNPDSLVSTGLGMFSKAVPAIAIAAAVVGVANKVVSEVIDFQTIIGGDYTNKIAYNNFKQQIRNITHPFSTQLNWEKQKYQNINLDRTAKLTNELHGDDYINTFNGYGV